MAGEGVGISPEVAATTIANWTKKAAELTTQKYAFTTALKNKKRIKYGTGGGELRWIFRKRDHDIAGHVDMGVKDFSRTQIFENAKLPVRGYDSNDGVSLLEKLQNRGPAAMLKAFEKRQHLVRDGLIRQLGKRWHKSGASTAGVNENRFHGIESFGGFGAQTAADELATAPNSTYAGHSCAYDTFKSGAVKGTDEEYGIWSPVMVNCDRNPGGGARAWDTYGDEYLRTGILEANVGANGEEALDMILLNKRAYKELLNILEGKERLVFDRGDDLGLSKFGFKQFFEFDGVLVGWDFGVPTVDESSSPHTVHGYGYNCDKVELCMWNEKQIWECIPNWNANHAADLFYFYSLGQLKFESPRYHAIFKNLTTAA